MTTTLQAPDVRVGGSQAGSLRKFRPDIEGLRAVAVVLVVLSHSGLALPGGYVGVDVFFVISGFLITRQLATEFAARNRISFAKFYARRVRRILPAATLVIVATLWASWKWDSPLRVRSVSIDGLYSAFSGINWRLAAQGADYFQATVPPSPFQHYWSLAVEEQFYAVWPALLVIVGVLAGRRYGRRTALIWALLLIIGLSLYLSVSTTGSSPSWAYFGAQTRAWELALGAFVAITVEMWTKMPPAFASQMSWLGLMLILLAAWNYTNKTLFPGVAVIMPAIGSAFVIAGGCPGWPRGAELTLKQRPMQFLGRISYSWYLWHWPVLMLLPLAWHRQLSPIDKVYAVAGSLVLAVATFYVVEQPIRTRQALVRHPRRGLVLGGVLVLISACSAGFIASSAGIPGGSSAGVPVLGSRPTTLSEIEKAVVAAAELKALPAQITPPLLSAPHDFADSHDCFVSYKQTAPMPDGGCTFGDPHGARTIVSVGDSHANAWFPAIDAWAASAHWKFIQYAKAACPPGIYPADINPISHRVYTECNKWRDAVFARVAAMKPDVVLITSQMRVLAIDPTGMIQTIDNFRGAGARVLYLEDTPFAGKVGLIPDCLALNSKDIQRCSSTRSDPSTRLEGMIQRTVEIAAAKRAGATLIDPLPWFCTATVCPPVIDGIVVYADNHHITATYDRWLASEMGQVLKRIIG